MATPNLVTIQLTLEDATSIRATFRNLIPGHNYTVWYKPQNTTTTPERHWRGLNPATSSTFSEVCDENGAGLLENTVYVFNIRDDSVNPPYLFYGESGKPTQPTIRTGTIEPEPVRPNYWYNWDYIRSGGELYVRASDWNSFSDYIYDLYDYTGIRQQWVVPYVQPNQAITAYTMEQACRAVNGLAPGYIRSYPSTGDPIAAYWFQNLQAAANSVR